MKNFIERLKKYKAAVVILVLIIGFVTLYYFLRPTSAPRTPQNPVVVPDTPGGIPGIDDKPQPGEVGEIFLLEVDPPANDLDKYFYNEFQIIHMTFSAPVKEDSVKIFVTPDIQLGAQVLVEEDPSKVRVFPRKPWEPNTRYVITVELTGANGEKLVEPVRYVWISTPPAPGEFLEAY